MVWYVLAVILIATIYVAIQRENKKIRRFTNEDPPVIAKNNRSFVKFAVGIIVAALSLNVYSGYETSKGIKQEIVLSAENIKSLGWCNNIDGSADGNGGYITYGGWPCINVSSDDGVRESSKDSNGKTQLCSNVTFQREVGLPNEQIFQNYRTDLICVGAEGASTYFKYAIFDKIKNDLDELNAQLCARFSNQLDESAKLTYCVRG